MKKLLISFSALVTTLAFLIAFMSFPWQKTGMFEEKVTHLEEIAPAASSDTLNILSWNIAFAYGSGSEGTGYQFQNIDYYIDRLKAMALLMRDYNVDIALLQEIDLDADRSHHIHQPEFLAKEAGFAFVAAFSSWESNYIPFPYWPPSRHFGKMSSGGAILSKYPLSTQQVQLHSKPDANAWWYNLFYLYRYTQFTNAQIGETELRLGNNHLEAFDKENRKRQAKWTRDYLLSAHQPLDILGGDFNTVPLKAGKKSDFVGYEEDDYRSDSTHTFLSEINYLKEPIELKDNFGDFLTFPSLTPDRQLDYLFVQQDIEVIRYEVLPAGDLSDHLPVLITIVLPSSDQ
jgi:endonuclease/exonuclease/phosphatase family metal-dependent hydrolase